MNKKAVPYICISALLLAIVVLLLVFVLTKPCGYCGSDGLVKCSGCKQGKNDCQTCHANGYLYCETCNGVGKMKCTNCSSKGYTSGETCPTCYGDGECSTFADLSKIGSSELLQKVYKNPTQGIGGIWHYTCSTCDGTGIERFDCYNCDGEGRYKCPECFGKSFGDVCPECNGSKKINCAECIGTGSMKCEKCSGTGKQFIWK